MKEKTLEEIREALIKVAWNMNHSKKGAAPLLVAYPNEVLQELFGKEASKDNWIPDNIKEQ